MPRQPQPAPFDGALVINKPQGKTSHDIVDAVRHLAGFRQIGHLGTLDLSQEHVERIEQLLKQMKLDKADKPEPNP